MADAGAATRARDDAFTRMLSEAINGVGYFAKNEKEGQLLWKSL